MSAPSPSSPCDAADVIGISVVIPAYGRPEGLLRAVDSVRAAVLRQLEIVVVDDASPISLEPAVPAYNSHGVPVRYYRLSRNGGPQSARNLGIRRARYPYVAFLDSDDIFFPEKIDVIRTYLSDGQCDLLFHAVEGLPTYARIGRIWNERLRRLLAFDWLVVFLNPVVTPSLVIRRAVLLGVPGMRYAEDWAFLLRIAQPKMSVVYVDMALSKVYRALGSEGGQSSARWAMRKGEFRARALLLRDMRPANYLKYAAGTAAGCVRVAWDLARLRYRRGIGNR